MTEMTTQEQAQRYLNNVLEDLDSTDPDQRIGDGYVYSHELGKWERFMLAGNGPTVYAYFLFDEDGDIDHAYVEYWDMENALAVIPPHRAKELLLALRRDVAAGIERHGR